MPNWKDAFKFWNAIGRPERIDLGSGGGSIVLDDLSDDDETPNRGSVLQSQFSVGRAEETRVDPAETARQEALAERERKADIREFGIEADEFLAPHKRAGKLNRSDFATSKALYVALSLDEKATPIEHPLSGEAFSRVEALKALVASRPAHALVDASGEGDKLGDEDVAIKPGEKLLDNEPAGGPVQGDGMTQERRFELLITTDKGRAVLRQTEDGRAYLKKHGKK